MKIAILDGHLHNPGDMSWKPFEALGEVDVYERTAPDEILSHVGNADIVLTNKVVLDAGTIARLDSVKYIGVLATGFNVVDIDAARRRGIIVTNIPSYSTMSVAQVAIAHLLNIACRTEHYTDEVRRGEWSAKPDACYWDHNLFELAGKMIGIVGFGNTGSATAAIAQSLGMTPVVFTSRSQEQLPAGMLKAKDLDTLFATCDVVSLHCPFNAETGGMVDARRLALMKPSAILINTARGQLVDEAALADALNQGRIYAAGIDVMTKEPPSADNPLLSARNCFITPHLAWATKEARQRLVDIAVNNIASFLDGKPVNVVNP